MNKFVYMQNYVSEKQKLDIKSTRAFHWNAFTFSFEIKLLCFDKMRKSLIKHFSQFRNERREANEKHKEKHYDIKHDHNDIKGNRGLWISVEKEQIV